MSQVLGEARRIARRSSHLVGGTIAVAEVRAQALPFARIAPDFEDLSRASSKSRVARVAAAWPAPVTERRQSPSAGTRWTERRQSSPLGRRPVTERRQSSPLG
jgi:hypothetical protein